MEHQRSLGVQRVFRCVFVQCVHAKARKSYFNPFDGAQCVPIHICGQ